jgi:hypothetical protein
MTKSDARPGQVVRHVSGGPNMTLEKILDGDNDNCGVVVFFQNNDFSPGWRLTREVVRLEGLQLIHDNKE